MNLLEDNFVSMDEVAYDHVIFDKKYRAVAVGNSFPAIISSNVEFERENAVLEVGNASNKRTAARSLSIPSPDEL
jgi:hypothetical protein